MLSQFSVKNYKCLADVSLPLTPIHVLIGQNDTGKTSLFEAIEAGAKLVTQPQLDQHPVNLFANRIPQELVWFGSNEKVIRIGLRIEQQAHGGDNVQVEFDVNCSGLPPKHQRGSRPPIVKAFVAQTLRFRPNLMARPAASNQVPQYQLQSDGFGLSTLLDEITGYDVNRYVDLQATFREYFPKYTRVMLTPSQAWSREQQEHHDRFQTAVGKEIRLATRDGELRLAQASDGAILLLGFLALTYSPKPPDLILIEEPENGIHPKRLIEVTKLLRRFVQQEKNAPQIIMTTHSPYLLSEFQPEEVTLMRRQPDGSAKAFPLRDAPHIRERMGDGFYLGELWYNLNEEDLLK